MRGLLGLIWACACQNAKLLEVTCHDSYTCITVRKVSGLDYWLSRELNCEVPQIICYYVSQENSYHMKGK